MKGRIALLGLLVLALPVVASGADVKAGAAASAKPHFEASQEVTAQATVLSVNKSKRTVKLSTEAGDTVEVECGPEVKNFAQIKAKDVVNATYTEKLTITVEGAGEAGESEEASMTSAKPGEKPKATASAKVTYKANITAIDKEKGTVSLKGADGREATVKPRNPANLEKVKVGDLVVFTYTQALAVSVAKAGAPAASK